MAKSAATRRPLLIALLAVLVLSPDVMGFTLPPASTRRDRRGSTGGSRSAAASTVSMARSSDALYDRSVLNDLSRSHHV